MTTRENVIHFIQGKIFKEKVKHIQRKTASCFCLTQFVRLYFVLPCMHLVFNCICAAIFCLMLSFSPFLCSLLLMTCGCFLTYNFQSFSLFSCLIVAFPRSFVYKALSPACWLNSAQSRSSLVCSVLLSLPNIHSLIVLFISSNRFL